MSITFSLISQDRVVTETEVDEVLIPTPLGQIGVLEHHAQLVTLLATGEVTTKKGGRLDHYAVFGGAAQINEKEVVLLADRAEHVDELDLAKAEQAKKQAEEMHHNAQNSIDQAAAMALIERNLNRISIIKRRRHNRA